MHLSDFIAHAKKQFPGCIVKPPATAEDVLRAEERLHITFPVQVVNFYQVCNGILFPFPFLEILSLDQIHFVIGKPYLKFCLLAQREEICFDTSSVNEAGQWFIKGLTEDYTITLTMASFWSNKVWHWLEKQRPIWKTDKY
jgi:hypothetical protein